MVPVLGGQPWSSPCIGRFPQLSQSQDQASCGASVGAGVEAEVPAPPENDEATTLKQDWGTGGLRGGAAVSRQQVVLLAVADVHPGLERLGDTFHHSKISSTGEMNLKTH